MLAGCPGLGPKRRVVPRCVVPRGAAAALGRGRCWAFHPGEQPGKFMPSIALSHSLGKMLGKQAEPNCVAPRYLLKVKGDPSLAGQPGLVRGEGLPALRRLEIQLSSPPGATTEAGTTASSVPLCELQGCGTNAQTVPWLLGGLISSGTCLLSALLLRLQIFYRTSAQ